ncbi:hypothetical protein GGR50DRAFT_699506 [Xylaria sp. CBS 124048]|nr:hypothetical protein GGR50DRAFT_699506 [Xylaria sp. CBS 124048]
MKGKRGSSLQRTMSHARVRRRLANAANPPPPSPSSYRKGKSPPTPPAEAERVSPTPSNKDGDEHVLTKAPPLPPSVTLEREIASVALGKIVKLRQLLIFQEYHQGSVLWHSGMLRELVDSLNLDGLKHSITIQPFIKGCKNVVLGPTRLSAAKRPLVELHGLADLLNAATTRGAHIRGSFGTPGVYSVTLSTVPSCNNTDSRYGPAQNQYWELCREYWDNGGGHGLEKNLKPDIRAAISWAKIPPSVDKIEGKSIRRVPIYRHLAALTIAETVMEIVGHDVKLFSQDPDYTLACIQIVSSKGFEVTGYEGVKGFTMVDGNTIVFAPRPIDPEIAAPVKEVIADIALPAAMIWETVGPPSLTMVEYNGLGTLCYDLRGDTPRTCGLVSVYGKTEMPKSDLLGDLSIYADPDNCTDPENSPDDFMWPLDDSDLDGYSHVSGDSSIEKSSGSGTESDGEWITVTADDVGDIADEDLRDMWTTRTLRSFPLSALKLMKRGQS